MGNLGLESLKSINRDMEEKGIVAWELSCRTAAELPARELLGCRRSFAVTAEAAGITPKPSGRQSGNSGGPPGAEKSGGGRSVAVRQLSSGSAIPFSSMSPPCLLLRAAGVLLSCRQPPPELLVRWSTKS
ncbi:unnamed protein product [Gadus morhua 'NCC']